MADNQEETESPIISAIRNYMMNKGGSGGVDNKEYNVAMNVDNSSGTPKGYSSGGVVTADDIPNLAMMPPVGPSSFDVAAGGSDTYKNAGNTVPPESIPPASAPISSPSMAGTPTAAPSKVPPPAMAHQVSAPPVPAQGGGLSDILAEAQHAGQQVSGQYSPENRAELYAYLAQQQNKMPYAIGNSLASVGDAITRGYGRSQSNFLNDTLGAEKSSRDEAMGAFDKGSQMHQEQMKQGLELSPMDPSSTSSKNAQQAFGGVLQKMGYSKSVIDRMPASQISTITEMGLKYADIQTQKDLKDATLQLQALQAKASIANAQTERQQTAAKAVAEEGPVKHYLNKLVGNKGMETLESELPGGTTQQTTKSIGGQDFIKVGDTWYHK